VKVLHLPSLLGHACHIGQATVQDENFDKEARHAPLVGPAPLNVHDVPELKRLAFPDAVFIEGERRPIFVAEKGWLGDYITERHLPVAVTRPAPKVSSQPGLPRSMALATRRARIS
jgi:hypothetical protein